MSTPHPVTVTTRIITFLVGNPYKPSFATGILGGGTIQGIDPQNIQLSFIFVSNFDLHEVSQLLEHP